MNCRFFARCHTVVLAAAPAVGLVIGLALFGVITPANADFMAGLTAQQAGDNATAFKEWRKDADAGNRNAQFQIAEMLRQGLGVGRDMKAAFGWYMRAAKQGLPTAQLSVGVMYGRAIGVARDDVEAYKWLSIAHAGGDTTAARVMSFVTKRLVRELGEAKAKKMIGEGKFRAATFEPRAENAGG